MSIETEKTNKNNSNNHYNYLANYIGGGINYSINPQQTLSYQVDYTYQKIGDATSFQNNESDIQKNEITHYLSENQNKTNDKDYTHTLFYKAKIGKELDLYSDVTYNHYSNNVQSHYSQGTDFVRQNLYREKKNYTQFNVEAKYNFSSKWMLQLGYKNVWREYNSKNLAGEILLDYTENRNQIFAYLQYKANEKLSLKFGTGVEYLHTKGDGKHDFWNIEPYLQFNYKINAIANLNVSYLTNSYYPSLYQLSPMTTAIDSLMTQSGNPNLRSAIRHSVTAGITFWDRLTVKSFFKFTPKRISEIYTAEQEQYWSTFTNIDLKQFTLQVIYDQPLGEYFTWSNMLVYYYQKAKYQDIKNSGDGWMINSELSYFHPKTYLGCQIGYYRNVDKSALLQGYQMLNFDSWMLSVQKQFWNKRGSLSFTYLPPLEWGIRGQLDKKIETPFYSERYSESVQPYRNMFIVRLGLRFNSGKAQKSSKQSRVESEERATRAVGM